MGNWFNKLIYTWGTRLRNPRLFAHFGELVSTDFLSREELDKISEERLSSLLKWAYRNSPFYKKAMEAIDFNPENGIDWTKFRQLPVVSKSDLINYNSDIQVNPASFEKIFYCESSGTSGQVLSFIRDENWDSFIRAAQLRGYSWYGIKPWDFNIYFWGYNLGFLKRLKLRLMDFLVNRYRIFNYDESSLKKLRKKARNASYIEGYSSMVYEMAKLIPSEGVSFPRLKMVKGTSEKIFPHYLAEVRRAFKLDMISEYGAAEAGIIAFECPKGTMHIVEEGVYVEVSESNEIIVTNLVSNSFPIIRYSLGDAVILGAQEEFCTCGRNHRVIKEVTGRVGKNILGKSNLYPSLTLYYVFKNIFFQYHQSIDYQAIQYQKGELEIHTLKELSSAQKNWVLAETKNYFGADLDITFKVASTFRMEKGKLKDFISKIPSHTSESA